jgi:hypothetical protein
MRSEKQGPFGLAQGRLRDKGAKGQRPFVDLLTGVNGEVCQ